MCNNYVVIVLCFSVGVEVCQAWRWSSFAPQSVRCWRLSQMTITSTSSLWVYRRWSTSTKLPPCWAQSKVSGKKKQKNRSLQTFITSHSIFCGFTSAPLRRRPKELLTFPIILCSRRHAIHFWNASLFHSVHETYW